MNIRNLLVIGANGYLGSNYIDHAGLIARYDKIVAAVRFRNRLNFKSTLPKIIELDYKRVGNFGDFLDSSWDVVFLSGLSKRTLNLISRDEIFEKEISPILELLKICRKYKVKKIFYASSGGSIYGEYKGSAFAEGSELNPIDNYGWTKLSIEKELCRIFENSDTGLILGRIGNPYGKISDADDHGLISSVIRAALLMMPFTIYGDPKAERDYIHVSDFNFLLQSLLDRECNFNCYNMGTGVSSSTLQVIELVEDALSLPIQLRMSNVNSDEVKLSRIACNRIFDELGHPNLKSLKQGINETIIGEQRSMK